MATGLSQGLSRVDYQGGSRGCGATSGDNRRRHVRRVGPRSEWNSSFRIEGVLCGFGRPDVELMSLPALVAN